VFRLSVRDALGVLLQALHELKVTTETITFTTGTDTSMFKQATEHGENPDVLRQRFSCFANLEIGLVKQFEEPVKAALRRLPNIRGTGHPWARPYKLRHVDSRPTAKPERLCGC